MTGQYLKSTNVFINQKFIPAILHLENDIIIEILPYDTVVEPLCDYQNALIIPGLIDIHTHGYGGWSFTGVSTVEDIVAYSQMIASLGITSILATTALSGYQTIVKAISNPQLAINILGIHAEGPFLNDSQPGAANPHPGFPKPNLKLMEIMYKTAAGHLKYLTFAPEIDGCQAIIDFCLQHDITLAAGHTEATYQEITQHLPAIKAMTHLGNAMKGIHHREVGAFGAGLLHHELFTEIIADGLHLSLETLQLIYRLKPLDKLIIISDSTALAGLPAGDYHLPNNTITLTKEGKIVNEIGRISGSSYPVLNGIKVLTQQVNVPLEEAIMMATINPATLLGLQDKIGSLDIDKHADITVLSDQFEVIATYQRGNLVYQQGQPVVTTNPKLKQLLQNPDFLNYYQ